MEHAELYKTSKVFFEPSWKDWIKTNLEAGQDKNGIFKVLLDDGYNFDSIVEEMNFMPTLPLAELVNPFTNKKGLPEVKVEQFAYVSPNDIFIPNAIQTDTDLVEIYTLDSFLNSDECSRMIALVEAEKRLITNTVNSAKSKIIELSTSDDVLIHQIDTRICQILGIDPAYSDSLEAHYIEVEQSSEIKADYFQSDELENTVDRMGQRTFTVRIDLNANLQAKSDYIDFAKTNIQLPLKAGRAIIWNNLHDDGSININAEYSVHTQSAAEVRIALVKRFRTNTYDGSLTPPMRNREINELVPNYTKIGFEKHKLPVALFEKIQSYYQANADKLKDEHVAGDFIYNTQKDQASSVLVELTQELRTEIHDAMKPMMEAWSGVALEPTYVYGIRVYLNQAALKDHRDRSDTHIISVIINVAQDVDEDWPLYIEDNAYRGHQVILKPGEVVFYEGARLTHGREIPLKGRAFANIFCHFKPVGYVPLRFKQD